MVYSIAEISEIKKRIFNQFSKLLELAIASDTINDFLSRFNFELFEPNPAFSLYDRKTKILVFGAIAGKKNDYILCAKKLGINPENLEFVDYTDTKTFGVERLRYSKEYSDIICGPMPHKIVGMGDTSSFFETIKNNPEKYPKYFNAIDKLTISTFKQALIQTRYMEKFSKI